MKTKRRNLIITLLPAIIIPLAYLAAFVYQRYIRIYIFPCPINFFMHIYCPGCGGTRCVYALLSGNILRALRCNAIYTTIVFFCVLVWIENLAALFGKEVKIIPRSKAFYIIASGIAAVYFILRNFIPAIAPV
ncbi:MAG: DUF2752 domain-containing protein [Ruminococcus sp.]|nr:DUF2752 domain-containing protein [Ruminococcus sp.]